MRELGDLRKMQELLDRHITVFYELLHDMETALTEGHEAVGLTRKITTLANRTVDDQARQNTLAYMKASLTALAVPPDEWGDKEILEEVSDGVGELFGRAAESVAVAIREFPAAADPTVRDMYITTIQTTNGPLAIGANAKASTEGLTIDDALRLLEQVRQAAADIADTQRTELLGALDELRAAVMGKDRTQAMW